MSRYTVRESVLLGYSPQSFNSCPKSPCDDSDIDFNDVFGGPPRRSSSSQETQHSFGGTAESPALRRSEEETMAGRQPRWSGLGEKPVFGDDVASRRRHHKEDFFDDIFGGNESFSSSPRKQDGRDLLSSSPGSRVLSPVCPLPSRAEPFGSPLPAQFSLPAKLIKGADLPTFGSTTRTQYKSRDGAPNGMSSYSSSPLSKSSSSQSGQVQSEVDHGGHSHSSLSQELNHSNDEPSNFNKPAETGKGSNSKRDSSSSEATSSSNQFHFSIYKWASKGVSLQLLPFKGANSSRLKEKNKFERCSSANGRIPTQGTTTDDRPQQLELDKQQNGSLVNVSRIEVEECQNRSEASSARQVIVKVVASDTIVQNITKEKQTYSVPSTNLSVKVEEKPLEVTQVAKKELKPLHSLLSEKDSEQSADEITRKKESKEIKMKNSKKSAAVFDADEDAKKQNVKPTVPIREDVDKDKWQGSPTFSQDNLGKNKVRGKVKEFVKIFNQEAPKETKLKVNHRKQSFTQNERSKLRTENTQLPNVKKNDPSGVSVMVDGRVNKSEKLNHEVKTSKYKSTTISSEPNDNPVSKPASNIEDPAVMIGDTDEFFQENFMIKEIRQEQDTLQQTEDIQDIDAKIRKWSNGKEGNIRSLLSTLQYVLWSGSGWKPVALVDIIEGNAVKRSYQKALLSLHPDKLQQKGATSQQKYTAAKVFDILQEAWTHFNTLGAV